MKKTIIIAFFLIFTLNLGFLSCKSAPEEEPVPPEEPVQETPEEPEKSGAAVEMPARDNELEELRSEAAAAVLRAEEVQAQDYAPAILSEAQEALKEGDKEKSSDAAKAAEAYNLAKEKAEAAFTQALEGMKAAFSQQIDEYKNLLTSQNADKYSPQEYEQLMAAAVDALSAFEEAEDKTSAARGVREAFYNLKQLNDGINEKLRWNGILKRDTELYLNEAETAEAFLWAPEVMEESSRLLMEGLSAQREYDLDGAAQKMEKAKYLAMAARKYAIQKKQTARTDARLVELMKRLENASRMTTISDDGDVVEPEPWEGESEVPENLPQPQLEIEETEEPDNEETSFLPLVPGKVGVLGDEQESEAAQTIEREPQTAREYLSRARELWRQGVQARSQGELTKAMELFDQSEIYLAAYENMAVSGVYTVQARTENHDCLWRIAEYDSIYGDPFLWPKIWRRNRQLIQNPDLIYPGWKLLIPPKE